MIIDYEKISSLEKWCPKLSKFISEYIVSENDKVRLKLKPFRDSIIFTINDEYLVKLSFRGKWTIELLGPIKFNVITPAVGAFPE